MQHNKLNFICHELLSTYNQFPLIKDPILKSSLEAFLSSTLSKRITILSVSPDSKNLYICQCSFYKTIISITQLKYSELKKKLTHLTSLLTIGQDFIHPLTFSYGFNKSWFLLTQTAFEPFCTLSEYLQILHINFDAKLLVEFIIKLILKLGKLGMDLFKIGVFIKKLPPEWLILTLDPASCSFTLKIHPHIIEKGKMFVELAEKCDEALPSQDQNKAFGPEFCGAIASLIHYCLSFKSNRKFQDLTLLSPKQIKSELKILPVFSGINNFIEYLMKKNLQNLEKSCKIQTWQYLLGLSPAPQVFSPSALCTGFFCDSSEILQTSIQTLLKVQGLLENLKEKYFTTALQKKIVNHLTEMRNYDIATFDLIYIFIEKVFNYKQSINISVYIPLAYKIFTSQLDLKNKSLSLKLSKILPYLQKGSTLTILKVFLESEYFSFFYTKTLNDPINLNSSLPFFGIRTLEKLKLHLQSLHPSHKLSIIDLFHHIPPHIKLQFPFDLLSELDLILSMKSLFLSLSTKENLFCRIMIFDIVQELLSNIGQAREANRLGVCYKNIYSHRVSPVMVKCLYCGLVYCVSCGRSHIYLNHTVEFLTHFKLRSRTVLRCSKTEIENVAEPLHVTHRIPPAYEKFPLGNFFYRDEFFCVSGNLVVLPNVSETFIVYYTEVLFEYLASEEFFIEFEGSKIVLNNNKAICTRNKSVICNMPKIGSGDNLGIGFTSDQFLFFTYNGFNLSKYIQMYSAEIKIVMKFKSFPKPPTLLQPLQSLYTGESLLFPDKTSIFPFQNLIKNLITLWKLRNIPDAPPDLIPKLLQFKSLYKEEELISLPQYKSLVTRKQDNCSVF